ncbi:MAG: CPBP family glutamic-type intramembrane protease [Ilumatobacteraceae bacterium]|nr:CPBP family glutamic-type intramembrane protease [Ilumatobacteraceae bacterium]
MGVAAGAILALTFVGWAVVFGPSRRGIWHRSWITAAVLVAVSVGALWGAGELGDAVGTVSPAAVLAGGAVGIVWVVVTQIGHAVLCRVLPSFIERVRDLYSIAAGDRRGDVLIALVGMAVAEEFVFRLLVQRELGLVVAVVAYTAVQAVVRNWALMLAGGACGVVWGLLYGWQEGLTAPLLAHIIWTGTLTFVWPLRGCSAPSVPDEPAIAGER